MVTSVVVFICNNMLSLAACVLGSESGSALSLSSGRAGTGTCYHGASGPAHKRWRCFTGLHTCTLHCTPDPGGEMTHASGHQPPASTYPNMMKEDENDTPLIDHGHGSCWSMNEGSERTEIHVTRPQTTRTPRTRTPPMSPHEDP